LPSKRRPVSVKSGFRSVLTLPERTASAAILPSALFEKFATEYRKPIKGLVRRAQILLATYPWPGNVRELENVIGNASMMADDSLIDIDDLPERFRRPLNSEGSANDALLSLEEVQRRHLLRVLEMVGGNKVRAAEVLGISRATIYQLLSRMKLEERRQEAGA